ncbi:MAG: hypothetical protein IMY72_10025 [Bacteroidetes bacterium]|nr:hypothetical protein [Bacteroidota bacterium]
MLSYLKNNHKNVAIYLFFTLVFTAIFLYISYFCTSDIDEHARFAILQSKGEIFIGNFILYGLAGILTLFSNNFRFVTVAICLIIGSAVAFKICVAKSQIDKIYYNVKQKYRYKSMLFALSMVFVFAIPIPILFTDGFFYRGTFAPNVWNNSTTILLAPFAILLFYRSYEQIQKYSMKNNIIIIVLVILNIFIKPNFFFVFITVYSIFLFAKYNFKKEFFYSILPSIIGLGCIIIQYILIFKTNNAVFKEPSGVALSNPAQLIELFPMYKLAPINVLFSLLFPLFYVVLNLKKMKRSLLFWYTFISFIVSILFFIFFIETGPRMLDGNFYWQIVICAWLCFFTALIALLKDIKQLGFTKQNKFLSIIYALHIIFGLVYLSRYLLTGIYY